MSHIYKFAAVFIAIILWSNLAAQPIDKRVFRIMSLNCGAKHKGYVQTGFGVKWNGQEGIATALHGINGCMACYASQETSGGERINLNDLELVAVDVERDVAFLSSQTLKKLTAPAFSIAKYDLKYDQLKVRGYPDGTLEQIILPLAYHENSLRKLGDWHEEVKLMCQQRNSPSCNIDVLLVRESPIVAGHSGAPVYNQNDQVVGIANGGLKGGSAFINWFIPYSEVKLVVKENRLKQLDDLKQKDFTDLYALPSTMADDRFPNEEGVTIKGKIMFGGYGSPPIGVVTNFTNAYATIRLMETETRKDLPVAFTYANNTGEYTISNVPTGKYTPFITLEAAYPFYKTSAGDFVSNLAGLNPDIVVAPYHTTIELNLNVIQSVHLKRPVDNQEERTFVGGDREILYRQNYYPTATIFEWDPVPGATRYEVTYILMDSVSGKQLNVQQYSTTQTSVNPDLQTNNPNTYYMFMVNAYKGNNQSDLIGNFFNFYKNGYSSWFEFKVLEKPYRLGVTIMLKIALKDSRKDI